jgi:hypothetical protein
LCCRNYLATFRVISETDLVLTMPKRYAARLNVGFGNRILPLPIAAPTLDLYLDWHAAVEKDRPIAGCAGWRSRVSPRTRPPAPWPQARASGTRGGLLSSARPKPNGVRSAENSRSKIMLRT